MSKEPFLKDQDEQMKSTNGADQERAEAIKAARKPYLDRIKGGLIGGAIGDALGYPVEFLSWDDILQDYGPHGIESYELDPETGTAVFSDDTQMSLFTANGILIGETRGCLRGMQGAISGYVHKAYLDWLNTQEGGADFKDKHVCWLYEIPDLHRNRAPGNTCLSALRSGKMGTTDAPLNFSRGCGGVMRVAPLALHYQPRSEEHQRRLDMDGANIAAITHGHPLGYLPAAILTHILSIGVYGDGTKSLREAVHEAWKTVKELYQEKVPAKDLIAMETLLQRAEMLSAATSGEDADHILAIGSGWTGEEALAIALFCCLSHPKDFGKAVTMAVNHGGDSDSTGAIAGNILGAWLGYDAIEEKWKKDLEMMGLLTEMAEDLCYGCLLQEYGTYTDEAWLRKYVDGHAR